MNIVSISQLKTRPSKIIDLAVDYPIAVGRRSQIKAYLIGKDLYEKLIAYLENYIDVEAVKTANFRQGRSFENLTKETGI